MYIDYLNSQLNDVFLCHTMMTLEDIMISIRKALNLPRAIVCKALNFKQDEIFRYENGKIKSLRILIKTTTALIKFYGLDTEKSQIILNKINANERFSTVKLPPLQLKASDIFENPKQYELFNFQEDTNNENK